MRVVILQPSYLPWLGYFDQMMKSDVFVVYDDVQYDKHGWRNRNRIKTPQGPQWLTVPVLTRGQGWPTNREIRIQPGDPWRRKHLQALRTHYAKAPHFEPVFSGIAALLQREWEFLWELNVEGVRAICALLGLRREIRLSSTLGIEGGQTDRLVRICRALGADVYLSGNAAKSYLDEAAFPAAGIRLEYHDYAHPTYAQLHGDFVSHLSIIDLLMNHGPRSLEILADPGPRALEEPRP
jgi:hypothetical protein